MNSSCTRVPQRTRRRSYGVCQKAATAARISSIWAADMRACGGISKARNSTRPRRPPEPSGAYILSMQNSVRCVLPVMSARMLRNSRSVSQAGVCLNAETCARAMSSSCSESWRASSMRGCWLDGPMNRPLNRYDRLGWLCQKPSQRLQQVGAAQERAVLGARAAHDDVVAAAGADVAAVEHEFFRGQPDFAGYLVELLGAIDVLGPVGGGMHVDLDHARVGGDGELQHRGRPTAGCSPRGPPCVRSRRRSLRWRRPARSSPRPHRAAG